MNRPTKYRAWDGKKFLYSELEQFYFNANMSAVEIPSSTGHEFYEKNYPFSQFTGLFDIKGTGIYDDDILGIPGNITREIKPPYILVKFDKGSYNIGAESETDYYIIGNACANPELLKQEFI